MIYLTTLASLTLIAYLIWVRLTLGYWSVSISMSFIDVKEDTGKVNWQFWAMLTMSAIALIANGIHYWNWNWDFRSIPFLVLGGLGIFSVALFCKITEKNIKIMHVFNAFVGFGVSILAFWLNYNLWYIPLLTAIFTGLSYWIAPKDKKILAAEIVLSAFIMIGLFTLNIKY